MTYNRNNNNRYHIKLKNINFIKSFWKKYNNKTNNSKKSKLKKTKINNNNAFNKF
jgi:hypothetical protein